MKVAYFKIQNIDSTTQLDKITSIVQQMLCFMKPEQVEKLVFDEYKEYEITIAFLTEYQMERLRALFDSEGILLEMIDITDYVLTGKIQKNEYFVKLFKDENAFESLDNFLRENLTPDMILDKINELGVEYLTDRDREILNS